MVHRQIADETGQQGKKIGDGGDLDPAVSDYPEFSGFLFDTPGFRVGGGGDQFPLTDVQDTANIGKECNVRIGNAPFPFAHGTFRNKEQLSQIFLGIVFLGSSCFDEGAKGLFVGHSGSPLSFILGKSPQKVNGQLSHPCFGRKKAPS